MTSRTEFVAEAWTWKGTPFQWQQSLKGAACDCLGMVKGVARELGLPEAQSPFFAIANYDDPVPVNVLRNGLMATLQRVTGEPEPGDVLLLKTGIPLKAQHLAIFTGDAILHCYGKGVITAVVAHPWNGATRKQWPVDSIWRFGSLTHG